MPPTAVLPPNVISMGSGGVASCLSCFFVPFVMENPASIRIRPGKIGWILVDLPYTEERVARIKTLTGRRWDPEKKCWAIPRTARTVQRLLALFSGDQIEVDPSLHSPKPEHPGQRPALTVPPGTARETLQSLRNEMKRKDYSPQTAKVYALHIKRLLQHVNKSPRDLPPEAIRAYLMDRKGISPSYHSQAVSAIKFLLVHVLKVPDAYTEAALP